MTESRTTDMMAFISAIAKINSDRLEMSNKLNRSGVSLYSSLISLDARNQSELISAYSGRQSGALRDMRLLRSCTDFNIQGVIGEGSFGKVFLVEDNLTGQHLALKQMSKLVVGKSAHATARTFAELDILSRINCASVVTMFSTFQDRDHLYMVQEYLSGGDLYSYIKHHSPIPSANCKLVIFDILHALKAVHSLGYIHRDLKPANIAINASGRVKLIDFGVCRKQLDASSASSIVGTPAYMAPEMLTGSYSFEVDVWSLGVVLYEMLTRDSPFSAKSAAEAYKRVSDHQRLVKALLTLMIAPFDARDFLGGVLTEVGKRATVDQLLKHSYLTMGLEVAKPLEVVSRGRLSADELPVLPGAKDLRFAGYDFRSMRNLVASEDEISGLSRIKKYSPNLSF
jgi:serine/threonine protein kinase